MLLSLAMSETHPTHPRSPQDFQQLFGGITAGAGGAGKTTIVNLISQEGTTAGDAGRRLPGMPNLRRLTVQGSEV